MLSYDELFLLQATFSYGGDGIHTESRDDPPAEQEEEEVESIRRM